MTLMEAYEGTGINSKAITLADKIINELQYTGEKKPYMWWEEFEKQLKWAFAMYDKREGRSVFSD